MNANTAMIVVAVVIALGVIFFMRQQGGGATNARALIEEGALVIDVRSQGEWKGGHLENARHVPVDQVNSQLDKIEKWAGGKDKTIVVYCASGMRSGRAKRMLTAAGFSHVENGGAMSGLR